jgi:ABC-type branched-subunit amino acid transport system ATPase component
LAGRDATTTNLLLTKRDMAMVFSIARKIGVLHQRPLIAEGAPETLRADKKHAAEQREDMVFRDRLLALG